MFRIGLLGLLLSGCTWIGDEAYNADLKNVDDDGDGVTLADGDCNDGNANVSPNAEEIWYDGIDSNCSGDNDFDSDNDGYVPPEHEGKMTTSYVSGVTILPLPGGDCNDNDDQSYPEAPDAPYDGTDSDCSGNDDYDQDSDGYVPNDYEGLSTANLIDQTLLPGGDCNDNDANFNPGEQDSWYDGIDSDCGGENDYDRDLDGFAWSGIPSGTDIGELQPGDCDDENIDIFPTQTETWYDGIDSDCGMDDDYDQDGDGYVYSDYEGLSTDGVPSSGNALSGDCDDLDPERYEGALENLGDLTKDYDCDLCDGINEQAGNNCEDASDDATGASSFAIESSEWLIFGASSNPHNVRVVANSNNLFVSTRANEVTTINPNNNTVIHYYSASFVSQFDLNNLSTSPSEFFRWRGKTDGADSNPYSERQAVAANDNYFVGAIGQETLNQAGQSLYRRLRISAKLLNPTGYFHLSTRTNTEYPQLEDVGIMIDSDDVIHAVGCESEDGLLQYARMPLSSLIQGQSLSLEIEKEVENMHMEKCELSQQDSSTGVLKGYLDGDFTEYTFALDAVDAESLSFTSQGSVSSGHSPLTELMFTDTTADHLEVITDPTGIWVTVDGVEHQVSTETDAKSAYGMITDAGDLIIGFATLNGIGKILIGDPSSLPTSNFEEFELNSGYDMEEVVVYPFSDLDGDKIFVSFLAYDGVTPKMGFGIAYR